MLQVYSLAVRFFLGDRPLLILRYRVVNRERVYGSG